MSHFKVPEQQICLQEMILMVYDVWQTSLVLFELNVWKDTPQIYEHSVLSEIGPNIDTVHCCFRIIRQIQSYFPGFFRTLQQLTENFPPEQPWKNLAPLQLLSLTKYMANFKGVFKSPNTFRLDDSHKFTTC